MTSAPPKTQLVLHIGEPKTGSTSIQNVLYDGTWACATHSIDYPRGMNGYQLVNVLKPGTPKEAANRKFRQFASWLENSQADYAVISCENFAHLDPAIVHDAVKRHFPAHYPTMRVLGYIRPHVPLFLSAYAQRIKVGTLIGSLDRFYKIQLNHGLLRFHERFSKWRDLFGDRFHLRAMDRSALRDGDVVADFLGFVLGDAPFDMTGPTVTNTSISTAGLAGLRLLQAGLHKTELSGIARLAVGARVNNLVAEAGPPGDKLRLHSALYDTMRARYADEAAAIDRDFLGAPIMTEALIRAEKDVVDTPQKWKPTELLPASARQRLRLRGVDLAKRLAEHPGIWERADFRAKGIDPALPDTPEMNELAARHMAEVDSLIDQVVAVLTTRPKPKKVPKPTLKAKGKFKGKFKGKGKPALAEAAAE